MDFKLIKFQHLFETLADGVFIAQDYQFVFSNPSLPAILGYKYEEFIGLHFDQVVSPEYLSLWTERYQQRISSIGQPENCYEVKLLCSDGTSIWVELRANRSEFNNQPAVLGIIRDITERKRVHDALITSESLLSATIDSSLDGVIHIDSNGVITRWNNQSEIIFGWVQDEVIGKPIDEVIIPSRYQEAHRRGMKHFLTTGEGPVLDSWIEISATHRNGHEFPVELSISSIKIDGHYHFSAFVRDLTERNQAKEKLIASEIRLRTIFNTEPECVTLISSEGIVEEINTAGLKMIEAESVNQILNICIYPLVTEQHRQAFFSLNSKVFAGESGILEFQMTGLKGGVRWLESHASPLRDANGNVVSMLSITRDITQRKFSEERVARLTKLYRALSEINQAIVRMDDESQLFPLVCRCAVEYGNVNMAWIGLLNDETQLVCPVERYGHGLDYLDEIVISSKIDTPYGLGPVGIAIRENRPVIVNDFLISTSTLPWQMKAKNHGWQSVGVFPIPRGGKAFGTLAVYQTQSNVFDNEVIELFKEMSTDISFALDNFDRKAKSQIDEKSLELAASIYEVSSEAMLVIDKDRKVIAINPAFSQITDYSEIEILGVSVDILRTNYHDKAFYQSISDELDSKGKWQGELWLNRKDQVAFPTLTVINSVFDNNGAVLHRVLLFNDISQKKETEEFIWRQANYDLLTGLPNRLMFQDKVKQEFKKSIRTKLPFSLLFLDLDNFKEVNDTLGHAYGDMLLKSASERILGCVRGSDTVARFGGDEFTILLSDFTEREKVNRVIESILQSLAKPFYLNEETVYLTASAGITCYPEDGEDLETLTKNADQAMYAAKKAGRNGYSYFTKSMHDTAQAQMRLANDMRLALKENQLWVAYQPIINLKSQRIVKAEALIRWQHPKLGLVNPSQFITIAESTGMISDIGEFVLTQAAIQVKLLQLNYDVNFQISVNVSPVQFNNSQAKYVAWRKKFQDLGLHGNSIVVEITEGLLLEANKQIKTKLAELNNAGIQIAIDDFGTGYSSLSYLKKFPIDFIKIDQSFIRNLTANSGEFALCEAMVVMAHKLGIEVIAEGVETYEHSKLLTEMGCDYAQGYYFAKPMHANEFLAWVKNFKPH